MTQKITIYYTDDVDGKDGAKPRAFGFQSFVTTATEEARKRPQQFAIDLGHRNWSRLRGILGYYSQFGRRAGAPAGLAGGKPVVKKAILSRQGTPAEIRAWAKAHNIPIGNNGRIPASVRERYERR